MIIIGINPFRSHFIPIISIARRLQSMGQKILIIGYEVSREWVESENFEFISIKACEDSDIKKYRRNHLYKDLERCYYQIHDEIYLMYAMIMFVIV